MIFPKPERLQETEFLCKMKEDIYGEKGHLLPADVYQICEG